MLARELVHVCNGKHQGKIAIGTSSSLIERKDRISQISDTYIQILPHDEKHQLTFTQRQIQP